MLKIGDFSKLAQVSVKTLRYYGKLGLLEPTWIDRFTGYRYYTLDQLPRLNRILALKDLGFSLEQIKRMLREDLPAAELRGMIQVKYAELERLVDAEHARLTRVAARLQQIEQEGEMPVYEVVLKPVPSQQVVGIRDKVGDYSRIGHLLTELRAHLRDNLIDLDTTTPFMALYYDREHNDHHIDIEAAVVLSQPLQSTGRTMVHELIGVETMAFTLHQGSYETLPGAYGALVEWVESNGYQINGPNRDLYLRGPGSGVEINQYVTEVQFPVARNPRFTMPFTEESDKMEPKIVTLPAFTVAGMKYCGKNENNEIKQLWLDFTARISEVKNMADDSPAYGVCLDMDAEGVFEYLAGVKVTSTEGIPSGMAAWEVPEQQYAVFPCTLQTIGEAYNYALKTWLPQSEYQRADGPDFELYDESFEPSVEGSEFSIYVPIKK
jgi:predicted transcriptional regulator YdeE